MYYCTSQPPPGGGVQHVVPDLAFGRRCACGRKVFALSDDGPVLRDAPRRDRLSVLVLFQAAARKAATARSIWETRLFC
jgi:hypothetical protein